MICNKKKQQQINNYDIVQINILFFVNFVALKIENHFITI